MRHSHTRPAQRSVTGAINRWVGIAVCLLLAGLCGFLFYQNEAYSRALETTGQTVTGVVVAQTLRPCMLGDICYRHRAPNLTHVGHATIAYPDSTGRRHQGQQSINNKDARYYQRGQRIAVRFPKGEPTNASFGNPGYHERQRLLFRIFYGIGLIGLLGGAFWISMLPEREFADGFGRTDCEDYNRGDLGGGSFDFGE